MHYKNLVDMLMDRCRENRGITFIDHPETDDFLSYRDLYRGASGVLSHLQSKGLKPGDEVILQLNRNMDFLKVFWACLLGKMVPVPVTAAANDDQRLKVFNIWRLLQNPCLVTSKKHTRSLEAFARENNRHEAFNHMEHRTVFIEDVEGKGCSESKPGIFTSDEGDMAYIQFSSGSTGDPKGVMLTHKNVLTNIYAIINGFGQPDSEGDGDRYFSWMPLSHDMGLIGFHLTPLAAGWDQTLMATQLFIRYPHLWLEKMSLLKSTLTVSPNFGYQYVLKHVDSAKNQSLELSGVRLIVNGAEPISPELCNEFLAALAPWGLRKNAIFPAYGLAEASLAVTVTHPREEAAAVYLDRNFLNYGERVQEKDNHGDAVSFAEVGTPVQGCSVKVTDQRGNTCGDGMIGEILIKGDNVTCGYYNNRQATLQAKTPDGWWKTGDLGFFRNGRLVITGRLKDIIFVKGVNYYPHDIERAASGLPGVETGKVAVCGVYNSASRTDDIVCFVVFKRSLKEFLPLAAALKQHLIEEIAVEVSRVVPVKRIPKTTSGKIQRYRLKQQYLEGHFHSILEKISALNNEISTAAAVSSKTDIQKIVVETWCDLLNLESVGENENFFDLGGNSTIALQVKGKLQAVLARDIDDAVMFKYPTIKALASYLSAGEAGAGWSADQGERLDSFRRARGRVRERIKKHFGKIDEAGKTGGGSGLEIAVIGMSGRFPGAGNTHEFWENLKNGVESISFFSDEELLESGVDPRMPGNPNYVRAKGILADVDCFDAVFFGYTPLEAAKMDPQMRVLHECSWEALEDAGYGGDPGNYPGLTGVYLGASPNFHWESAASAVLPGRKSASQQFVDTQLLDKDFITTRLSYKLNLTGPSLSMYTACSTSLAAVDLACQGLLCGRCDMALAGGVSIWLPRKSGYLYEENMLFSRDGHNRTFDRQASGTVFSDGAAIVLLKRLADALADRDHIYAVIKGSAVNNDGDRKIGYTAPGLEGQAEVIVSALQMAGVEPESIGYVETHGTATTLGDPIEIDALNLAFHTNGNRTNYCAIGSVKSNIGHLNAAAGAAGLIKTILILNHRLVPPGLHFNQTNPRIDFAHSPFYVNTRLKEWKQGPYPRRAGVSSFGIGGTNAHVVVEEIPVVGESRKARKYQLIPLSAKTPSALDKMTVNLARFLEKNPDINLADAAYTLQVGRRAFPHRRIVVCPDVNDAVDALSNRDGESAFASRKVHTFFTGETGKTVVFMFSGLGSQYTGMGRDLYDAEPVFRRETDRCFAVLDSLTGYHYDIKEILYPSSVSSVSSAAKNKSPDIHRFEIAQVTVFIIEYALARLLMKWGIQPAAVIGYSFGEYAAACIAGVISLEDALKLVTARGRLMSQTAEGAMSSVPLAAEQLQPLIGDELSIAVDNGASCIVAGPVHAVETFETRMKHRRLICIRLETNRAVHSQLTEPILTRFQEEVNTIRLHKPRIPYISNVTGDWISRREAVDHTYWVRHLRGTVRFSAGLSRLLTANEPVFLEIGPGRALSTQLKQPGEKGSRGLAVNTLKDPGESIDDVYYLLHRVGQLWLRGVKIDWQGFNEGDKRQRLPLPTYPFAGQRCRHGKEITAENKKADISRWFYYPSWKLSRLLPENSNKGDTPSCVLIFPDDRGLGIEVAARLEEEGGRDDVITVEAGPAFRRLSERAYVIDPREPDHYHMLLKEVCRDFRVPDTVLHLWGVTGDSRQGAELGVEDVNNALDYGFYSLTFLIKAAGSQNINKEIRLVVVTDNMQEVTGEEELRPEKAAVLGACKVIPQEYPNVTCSSIDIVLPGPGNLRREKIIRGLLAELKVGDAAAAAYRGNHRWVREIEPMVLTGGMTAAAGISRLRKEGVYLVTGGLGGAGYTLAAYLAKEWKARLALTGRTILPAREQWDRWLDTHPGNDMVGKKIRRVQQLEASGTEVLTFSADVTDAQRMREVISRVEERLGTINGVVHAAGIVAGESLCPVHEIDKRRCQTQFQAKIYGLMVLNEVFAGKELDFYLLMSSLASVLGGPGNLAYSSANNFMDAFARSRNRVSHTPWFCVNWDWWQNPDGSDEEINDETFRDADIKRLTITPAEGGESFKRILSLEEAGQVMVSISDLPARIGLMTERRVKPPLFQQARPSLMTSYEAPRTSLEHTLVDIWQRLLGYERIGTADNFFELGGDSLKAVMTISRIQKEMNIRIPLNDFFADPTIKWMARCIGNGAQCPYSPIKPVEKKEYYPLSSAQQRMFLLHLLHQENTLYHNPAILVVEGELDIKEMEEIFKRLIKRHESLRTSFVFINDEAAQRIHETVDFSIEYYEAENTADKDAIIKNFLRVFDLSRAPLLRAGLIKINSKKYILMMDMYHIISDGTSMGIFVHQLMTLAAGKEPPALQIQYKDYARWYDKEINSPWMKEQEDYWLKQYETEVPVLDLPLDYPRPAKKNSRGSSVPFEICKEDTRQLKALALEQNTTLFILLLSLYYVLLWKLTGQQDIVVGSIVNGRTQGDLENVIGTFVNTIFLRNYPQKNKTFRQFLKEVNARTLEAFENQDYQTDALVDKVVGGRQPNRHPLTDVGFQLQNLEMPELKIPGLKLSHYSLESSDALGDLICIAVETGENLLMTFKYWAELFKKETIQRFSRYFKEITASVLKNKDTRLENMFLSHDLLEPDSTVFMEETGDFGF